MDEQLPCAVGLTGKHRLMLYLASGLIMPALMQCGGGMTFPAAWLRCMCCQFRFRILLMCLCLAVQ